MKVARFCGIMGSLSSNPSYDAMLSTSESSELSPDAKLLYESDGYNYSSILDILTVGFCMSNASALARKGFLYLRVEPKIFRQFFMRL